MSQNAPAPLLHHKDSSPEATIQRVKEILRDVGLSLIETAFLPAMGDSCSLSLSPTQFAGGDPAPSTNGKGMNRLLAHASACGEFMERLQNSTGQTPILIDARYGLMPERLADPPDSSVAKAGDLQASGEPAVLHLLDIFRLGDAASQEMEVVCFPFYSATQGKVVALPAKLVRLACGSNGMCAGNTPEEAISQGICEILERYAMKEIFQRRLALPTIPSSELRHLASYPLIEELEKNGLRVLVKDCSLGGVYPVVAVLTFHPSKNRYHIHFGSNPVFDVALQRCLCESLQGYTVDDYLKQSLLPVLWNDASGVQDSRVRVQDQPAYALSRCMRDGNAQYANSVFVAGGKPLHHAAFADASATNGEMLQALFRTLEREGHKLLVRDVSYLGFPSYYVYVPGLSDDVSRIELSDAWLVRSEQIRKSLLRLPGFSFEEARALAETLEAVPENPTAETTIPEWFGIIADEESGLPRLYQRDVLMAELWCRVGDYGNAFGHIDRHARVVTSDAMMEFENCEYVWCALACLKLKSDGLSKQELHETLSGLFGEDLAVEVQQDIGSPEKGFKNCLMPACGDCSACVLQGHCYYDAWRELVGRLNEKMAAARIDQLALARLFPEGARDPRTRS